MRSRCAADRVAANRPDHLARWHHRPRDKVRRAGTVDGSVLNASGRLPSGQCTSNGGGGVAARDDGRCHLRAAPSAGSVPAALRARPRRRLRREAAHSAQTGWCRQALARRAAERSCAPADIRRATAAGRGFSRGVMPVRRQRAFVFLKTAAIVAERQQRQRPVEMRVGEILAQRDRLAVARRPPRRSGQAAPAPCRD